MNRHVMHAPQTSLQGSCKLGDGALLLHGSDRGHHPELDHQKPTANRLGYSGAQKILAANGRSVTWALTTGKSVVRREAFPQSVEKGGDSLNLRKCGGRQ